MNPLAEFPAVRKALYAALWVFGLILTAWQGWVAAVDAAQPVILTGCLAVFPAVASYVGYTAQRNVDHRP